jgi:hypothetical protein
LKDNEMKMNIFILSVSVAARSVATATRPLSPVSIADALLLSSAKGGVKGHGDRRDGTDCQGGERVLREDHGLGVYQQPMATCKTAKISTKRCIAAYLRRFCMPKAKKVLQMSPNKHAL